MSIKIGCVSQKGGVGKSTLARLISVEYSKAEWNTKIADLDTSQGTCVDWNRRRNENKYEPEIAVQSYGNVSKAIKDTEHCDLLIFDGQARSDIQTLEIAKEVDLLILPTGASLDDLEPAVRLANDLKKKGISPSKIAFARSRTSSNDNENTNVEEYLNMACDRGGYILLNGALPEFVSIRNAMDDGHSPSEVIYKSVHEKVDVLVTSIVNKLDSIIN